VSGAFNSFQPHEHIRALERSQIPENDKGAGRQRQILLSSERLSQFFRYANLGRPPYGCRLGYSPQGTWNKLGATEEATVNWSGMERPQFVRWSDGTGFSYFQGFMVQPCGGG